ncbi:MAG: bifunctional phosphopantothenoylcysteine decarboxylase/phosphopantothenate--cysteine ligase CoaBC, partial [Haloferacaceae archaeon]
VTGSIAAVRVVELAHELRREGATVRAVMTGSAEGIVHPWAVEFATDAPPVTEITGRVEHVDLCGREGWADVLLVAPATANTVGKVAAAIDDTPVTTCATTALGAGVPVVVAPAMHEPMYDHPGVLDALDRLESWGVDLVSPRLEEEKAKIARDEAIVTAVARATGDRPLDGQRVVVTGGGTAEAIDPVRVLTNRASGRTGRAIARACRVAGADVTLVHAGVGDPPEAPGVETVGVESTAELLAATLDAAAEADALVASAAVGDFTVEERPEKIRSGEPITLDLQPTPKVITEVREAHPDLPVVGFKLEPGADDDALVGAARTLMDRTGLAMVVANDADALGGDRTRSLLVRPDGDYEVVEGSKADLGARVATALPTR